MRVDRPGRLFDRNREWALLERFWDLERPGARLGIAYGRRRQGKTALLEAFAEVTDGFYWQALEETSAQNLRDFSAAWNAFRGSNEGQEFPSWSSAIASLFDRQSDTLVILDEFGYLLDVAPEVPSLIQAQLTPRAQRNGRTKIVLCGSAFSQMRGLLSGGAALRGRAELELVIQPFDFRTAAAYWKLDGNVDAAFQLHALLGGTPAYLALARVAPKAGNVEKWMIEHLLDPASPLFREGRIVVTEDPTLADRALYLGNSCRTRRRQGSTGRPLRSPWAAADVDRISDQGAYRRRLGGRAAGPVSSEPHDAPYQRSDHPVLPPRDRTGATQTDTG
jgi:uncharacterized protein